VNAAVRGTVDSDVSPNKSNARARERAAAARAAQRRAERRRAIVRWTSIAAVVAVIIGGVIGIALSNSGGSNPSTPAAGALGAEGIPLEPGRPLAPASTAAAGQTVAGIQCQSTEQVAYHIHAHLAVFVNGSSRPIPLGIGVVKPVVTQSSSGGFAQASTCYYWLHTHVQDGVIHVESPTQQPYTLGQFFDEWRQPLSASQVAGAKGAVTAYVNGKPFPGNPRSISLSPHATIQLDVGSPTVAPRAVDWSKSTL
jgi:hypothetical protein